MDAALLILFIASLMLAFVLSGMEAGVFSLSRWRIRHQMRSGNPRARVLYGYLENPDEFLWTILVGNTIASVTAVSLMVMFFYQSLSRWPALLILTLAASVLLFYALFELLPKTIFSTFPNRLCMLLAAPFRFIHLLFKPLVSVLMFVVGNFPQGSGAARIFGHVFSSREEMRWVMQEAAPGLTAEERVMINRVLDLEKMSVGQIALPMRKAVTVGTRTSIADVLKVGRETGYTRLPVRDEQRNRTAGIISLRVILRDPKLDETRTTSDYLTAPLTFDSQTRLESALRQMQRMSQHLAIVTGPDKSEIGVVSLQDILKVIFGDVTA
ncbi:MAG TPA: CNNM domain-containing protein [Candidatus Binatia bacterium]|nr:CNNM domain-containing protein [Candidatus Binatia bacterium]